MNTAIHIFTFQNEASVLRHGGSYAWRVKPDKAAPKGQSRTGRPSSWAG
jgi:hypothetical protein